MGSTQSKRKCKSEVFNIDADGRMWKYILKAIRETTARGPETELWDEDKPALVCSYNFSFLFTWSIFFTLVYTCCLFFFCILLFRFFNFFRCLVFFFLLSLWYWEMRFFWYFCPWDELHFECVRRWMSAVGYRVAMSWLEVMVTGDQVYFLLIFVLFRLLFSFLSFLNSWLSQLALVTTVSISVLGLKELKGMRNILYRKISNFSSRFDSSESNHFPALITTATTTIFSDKGKLTSSNPVLKISTSPRQWEIRLAAVRVRCHSQILCSMSDGHDRKETEQAGERWKEEGTLFSRAFYIALSALAHPLQALHLCWGQNGSTACWRGVSSRDRNERKLRSSCYSVYFWSQKTSYSAF